MAEGENKEFAKNLEKRTRWFAVSVIRLSMILSNTSEGKVVRNQLRLMKRDDQINQEDAMKVDFDFNNLIFRIIPDWILKLIMRIPEWKTDYNAALAEAKQNKKFANH